MMSLRVSGHLVGRVGTKRSISFGVPKMNTRQLQGDMELAVQMVKIHDPVGFVPGQLLPENAMSVTYYAVRSFWVQTGLRVSRTAYVPEGATPIEHLEWWQQGIDYIYDDSTDIPKDWDHPALRLLQLVIKEHDLSKVHFQDIIMGRRQDIDLKQYPTMDSLIEHALLSCGSLSKLVLQSGGVTSPIAYKAAEFVGVAHGLTNALRTSIPVISSTGKLVVPQDLCIKYGVKSPRYLLSALGLGDVECRKAFHNAVRDIANEARSNLQQARSLRDDILQEKDGAKAVATFIPALASETFLDRLDEAGYDLTNRDLRHVGTLEHALCATRMLSAYYHQQY
jgi:phytoene/squalene synthetase